MTKQIGRTARTKRIADWLNTQIGDIAPTLRLELDAGEGETSIVAQWQRPKEGWDCEAVAQSADLTIQNYADETEARATGELVLYTADEKAWTRFAVRADPVGGAQSFDGSTKNLLVQNQKHLESLGMGYAKATEAMLRLVDQVGQIAAQNNESVVKVLRVLSDLVTVRESRGLQLEQSNAALRDENSELRAAKTEAEVIAENVVGQAEEAAAQVEELRKKGTEDAEIFSIVKNALAANNQEPKPKKKKAAE